MFFVLPNKKGSRFNNREGDGTLWKKGTENFVNVDVNCIIIRFEECMCLLLAWEILFYRNDSLSGFFFPIFVL